MFLKYLRDAYIVRHLMGSNLIKLILLFLLSSATMRSQTDGFEFLPGETLFPPLLAHYQEPRTGLRKEIGSSRMKLDIGSMLEALEYRFPESTSRLQLGIDFFTYALTTSNEGFRLQVDAVDGFFGGHLTFATGSENQFITRLRLLHVSAHFLDGHYDGTTSSWKGGRDPIPYTRDFGELIFAYNLDTLTSRVYGGFGYATLVRPENIERFTYHLGAEFCHALGGAVFGKPFNVFVAADLTISGIPEYQGTSNLEFGIKFGPMRKSGIKIYGGYYNGYEVFGQYYDVLTENWGIGFAFDFW